VQLTPKTQKFRRLTAILRQFQISPTFDWDWWDRASVVYIRLHHQTGDFYIGSSSSNVFSREQTRYRKYRQLKTGQLAYFEPALKLWAHHSNFYEFGIFPLRCCDTQYLLAEETAVQTTCQPVYNWPWISPLLKKFRIGKQLYGPTNPTPGLSKGAKFLRRYQKRTSGTQCCILAQRLQSHTAVYKFLYELGSDTLSKFECSKLLRSYRADIDYIFTLWRCSKHLQEPFRTRAQTQLRLILKFRGTEPPPSNVPLRLYILNDNMSQQIRQWLLGFTFQHRAQFPPLHKVRAPYVRVKSRTLASYVFNFRQFLVNWHPGWNPSCLCHRFPHHVQSQHRKTEHISCFASAVVQSVLWQSHLSDEVHPSWQTFFYKNTESFEFFLRRWKLPSSLMQYWQAFLRSVYFDCPDSKWTPTAVLKEKYRFQQFVISPADHHPHTATFHCPVQWHFLLSKTFLDTSVFHPCAQAASQVLVNIQQNVPTWIHDHYGWGLDFGPKSRLSSAYILPKPTRDFQKARPIVDYSGAWPRKLGTALSVALYEILNTVFRDILKYKDVQQVIKQIHRLFIHSDFDDQPYELLQSDIAGFYNQVEHDRIIQAVKFAVFRFIEVQNLTLDTPLQTHVCQQERVLRVFRGKWRSRGTQYREIQLRHVVPLVGFLLRHSYFSVGHTVFFQHRGASMGSQWAPILCSTVALIREQTLFSVYPSLLAEAHLHHRYVDNRILILPSSKRDILTIRTFWNLQFYTKPIILEIVDGQELLGFTVDPVQRTVTFIQPWYKALRSSRSSGTLNAVVSGITARMRLIALHTWPPELRISQIQDLMGLIHHRDPDLFTPAVQKIFLKECRKYFHAIRREELFSFVHG